MPFTKTTLVKVLSFLGNFYRYGDFFLVTLQLTDNYISTVLGQGILSNNNSGYLNPVITHSLEISHLPCITVLLTSGYA